MFIVCTMGSDYESIAKELCCMFEKDTADTLKDKLQVFFNELNSKAEKIQEEMDDFQSDCLEKQIKEDIDEWTKIYDKFDRAKVRCKNKVNKLLGFTAFKTIFDMDTNTVSVYELPVYKVN